MSDEKDSRPKWTRRSVILAAATGLGAAGVEAITSDSKGNLYGGTMALDKAYNVAGSLWVGPDSAKSNVEAKSGRVYLASDTDVEYVGDNGNWKLQNVGSQQQPVPETHAQVTKTEELSGVADHIITSDADYDNLIDDMVAGDTAYIQSDEIVAQRPFQLPNDATLVGSEGTVIKATSGLDDVLVQPTTGCVIQNVTLDHDYVNQTAGGCTSIPSGESDIAYINVKAINGYRTCFTAEVCDDIRYIGCIAEAAGDDNWAIGTGGANITLTACISRSSRGALSNSSSGFECDDGAKDITFNGCIAYDCPGAGFEVHDHTNMDPVKGVEINGCISVGCKHGLRVGSASDSNGDTGQVEVSGFTVRDTTGIGIVIDTYPDVVSVSDTHVYNPGGASGVEVRGNPTNIDIHHVLVRKGPASSSTFTAINIVGGTDITVSEPRTPNAPYNGVVVDTGVVNVEVHEPKIPDAGNQGVKLAAAESELHGGRLTGCNIAVAAQAANVQVDGTTILDSASRGVTATAGNISLKNIRVDNATDAAVRGIGSTDLRINNSELTNSGYGVRTTDSSTGTELSNVHLSGNTNKLVMSDTAPRWNGVIAGGPFGGIDLTTANGEYVGDRAMSNGTNTTAYLHATWTGGAWQPSDGGAKV